MFSIFQQPYQLPQFSSRNGSEDIGHILTSEATEYTIKSLICRGEWASISGAVDQNLNVPHGAKLNEDAVAIIGTAGCLWMVVADGCTSLNRVPEIERKYQVTAARFASNFVVEQMRILLSSEEYSKETSPQTLIRDCNSRLDHIVGQELGSDRSDPNARPRTTLVVTKIDPLKDRVEFAYIGDGIVLADYGSRTESLFESQVERFEYGIKLAMCEIARSHSISIKQARESERIKEALLNMQREYCNRLDLTGFGILDGSSIAISYVQHKTLPLSGLKGIFLGSDGCLSVGRDYLKEDDRRYLFSRSYRDGVLQLLRDVKISQDEDCEWCISPRWKHSDDGSAVLVRF